MFNLKKNLFLEGKMQSLCSGKYLRTLVFLGLSAAPFQWVSAQFNLSLTNPNLGSVIKEIQAQSDYQFFYDDKLASVQLESLNVTDSSLQEVLSKALSGKNISYKIDDRVVYLSMDNSTVKKSPAQSAAKKTITGRIVDATGEPLIGVTIMEKGTTNGSITDYDGNYTVSVPGNAVLQFSYIGYKSVEMKVEGKEVIDLTMHEDTEVLDEVVVTALGIKREKKMLGYAVQELKSDELNKTGDPSVTSALQGKVAGLSMNTSSTGLGGSTKITIRGNSSLSDNNQPLWIVDGVPFSDNNTSDASMFGGVDRGSVSLDINPDDIESISVLKGPNAAALYGSRAGNGVILVTTKKGSKKEGFGVRYSGNFTWSKVAETLDMQTRYGQGHINPTGGVEYSVDDSGSWGPVLNGDMYTAWNGEEMPFLNYGNKLKDYFDTGFSQTHNVSVSNTTETSHYRASFGAADSKGVFPTEKLNRVNIDLNAGTELNKYFSMEGKISLSRTKGTDRPYYGVYGAINQLIGIPNNVRLDDLKEYSNENQVHVNWVKPSASIRNPYYVLNQRHNSDERWRAFGYYNAKINFTDWLHFSAKYAFDYYRTRLEDTNLGDGFTETTLSDIHTDEMNRSEENFFESNAEFLLMGDKQLTDNFRLGFTAGANFMYQKFETLGAGVRDMLNKNMWMLNAANILNTAKESGYERAMNSVFGSAQLAWKEYLSLDLTARNDWSSTLPKQNNSFFYPSANLSFVISDFVRSLDKTLPDWMTFAKLRLSAAQVGKDTNPYQLYNTYDYIFENGGKLTANMSNVKMNDQLKPEIATSYEVGLDMKFLNNRLGFDFTYYYSKTKNQIMKVPAAAPWSGGKWVNAGLISNQGVELMLYSTIVDTKDFTFDLNVNMAHNVSMVKELAEGVDYLFFDGDSGFPIKVGTRAGHKLGEIYASEVYMRDENGNILVGANGLPMRSRKLSDRLANPIGNIQPKLTMSVSPSFTYKGISLSAMFDMRFGGDIYSYSEALATGSGLAKRTENRGEDNNYMMIFPGVHADGTPNTTQITASNYYGNLLPEDFLYDASFIKLKELSLGYSFPSKMLKKTPLTALNVSFVARNLCYLLKHTPGTSPEGGYDTTMFSQAIDFAAIPFTRTFGFSVSLGF